MTVYSLIAILLVAAVVVVVTLLNRHIADEEQVDETCRYENGLCSSCSATYGSDECMSQKTLRQATEGAVYFDDEELDVYRGRDAEAYNDDEVEQFAEVLYSMHRRDVADWLASLTVRGINLPESLKSEAQLLME